MAANGNDSESELVNEYWGFEDTRPIPAAEGIRARNRDGRFTTTWWGGAWMSSLTRSMGSSRLARGRAYARQGQVLGLDVQPGEISAQVQGTQPTPYRVRIKVKALSDAEWHRVVQVMAGRAIYAAQLLNGEMPRDVAEVFDVAGLSLFPTRADDFVAECSCPDWPHLCKHIAAVQFLVGERLDEDPFLLFLMRGRSKEQVLAALRAEWVERVPNAREHREGSLHNGDVAAGRTLEASLETFWKMGPEIEAVQIKMAPPEVEMEIVKLLGGLVFAEDAALEERLQEVYRLVSREALGLAFGVRGRATDGRRAGSG